MKLRDYLRDRIFVYLMLLLSVGLLQLFLRAFRVPAELTAVVAVIFALYTAVTEIWNYMRRKNFYNDLKEKLEGLDRKYLISEMLGTPSFYEGKLLCEVLQESNRSMCENIAGYRKSASDFREFIEMWVHEVKLPVSSLSLMAHNHKNEFADKVLEQTRRIDGYTDTVLYYARSENAEKDYLIKEVSLRRAVSNAAVKNREDLLLHHVELGTENLDVTVMTDGKWLEFILGQLFSNSMKYTAKDRQAGITVSAQDLSDRTILRFRDNGIGIPESDLPYIFEKSFTGENGRSQARSTGMGLYIVKNLCSRLGHVIEARSRRGEYTEFTITFAKNDFYRFD